MNEEQASTIAWGPEHGVFVVDMSRDGLLAVAVQTAPAVRESDPADESEDKPG